mmetsp:Transcript_20235/g.63597  ORF Transcript_20235/g.63597 Transcript_20235/m.63597 type:complete len:332 (+) Transcript_20235:2-997(+)
MGGIVPREKAMMMQRVAMRAARVGGVRRWASTLVVAEHDEGKLSGGTLAAVTAAQKMGTSECVVLVLGSEAAAAEASRVAGVSKVVSGSGFGAKGVAALVESLSASHVVAASSNKAKEAIPRLAARLERSPVTEVVEVVDATTFVRPMYAGNALATVRTTTPAVVTIRATAFEKAELSDGAPAPVETVDLDASHAPTVLAQSRGGSADKVDLTAAKTVVSGGRGMKSGDNFELLDKLAAKFDTAAVGASRAAVDAGMVPNDLQVGQTGKVVAPQLYVAVGISGAIQHLSGMKDSKVIVAINKDPEAPIFQVADYGLVDDLFSAVPALTDKL